MYISVKKVSTLDTNVNDHTELIASIALCMCEPRNPRQTSVGGRHVAALSNILVNLRLYIGHFGSTNELKLVLIASN